MAELTERDWSVIARTNCLLSGQRLTFGEDLKNPIVERTPFNGMFGILKIAPVTKSYGSRKPSRSKVANSTHTKLLLLW